MVLALTIDGKLSECKAPEDKRGQGRCNHITHKNDEESQESFMKRISDIKFMTPEDNISDKIDGEQKKYLVDDKWYKLDKKDTNESLSEELVSLVSSHIKDFDYVDYKTVQIVDENGYMHNASVSESFVKPGESVVSMHDMMNQEDLMRYEYASSPSEQFDILVSTAWVKTGGLDIKSHLNRIIALDCIIMNPDRHLGNLAFIKDEDGKYRIAPNFDNGLSLMANKRLFSYQESLEDNMYKVPASTFSKSEDFEDYINIVGEKASKKSDILEIDKEGLLKDLESYKNSLYKEEEINRAKEIIKSRLEDLELEVWIPWKRENE